MGDDIVTRLRGWKVEPYPIPIGACIENGAVMEEAADEIERLRASVINTFDYGFDEIELLRQQPKFHFIYDRDEYWVITKLADGVMHKTGASFTYKEEAERYVCWLNKGTT